MLKAPLFFLADDDVDDQLLFREALREIDPGIICLVANNGKQALELLQNDLLEAPGYIFLDLNMPVMTGLQCLASIKKDPLLQHIPVILYSTSVSALLRSEAMSLGAADIYKKPDDYNGLLTYLKNLLDPLYRQ